jgi:hypothetical protein
VPKPPVTARHPLTTFDLDQYVYAGLRAVRVTAAGDAVLAPAG